MSSSSSQKPATTSEGRGINGRRRRQLFAQYYKRRLQTLENALSAVNDFSADATRQGQKRAQVRAAVILVDDFGRVSVTGSGMVARALRDSNVADILAQDLMTCDPDVIEIPPVQNAPILPAIPHLDRMSRDQSHRELYKLLEQLLGPGNSFLQVRKANPDWWPAGFSQEKPVSVDDLNCNTRGIKFDTIAKGIAFMIREIYRYFGQTPDLPPVSHQLPAPPSPTDDSDDRGAMIYAPMPAPRLPLPPASTMHHSYAEAIPPTAATRAMATTEEEEVVDPVNDDEDSDGGEQRQPHEQPDDAANNYRPPMDDYENEEEENTDDNHPEQMPIGSKIGGGMKANAKMGAERPPSSSGDPGAFTSREDSGEKRRQQSLPLLRPAQSSITCNKCNVTYTHRCADELISDRPGDDTFAPDDQQRFHRRPSPAAGPGAAKRRKYPD